jgi:hypothetical protein
MTLTRRSSRLLAGLGIAGTTVLLVAGPAAADTSAAHATAATVTLFNSPVLNTGVVTATNDGTVASPGTVTGNGGTVVLSGQTLLSAGVLSQIAIARPDGTSAACAGAVGTNGVIQIGPNGVCTGTGAITGGVTVNVQGLATLRADVLLAQCTASSTGAATGSATIVNANVFLLNAPLPIAITPTGAANQGPIDIPGIATVHLNEQVLHPDGSLTVNALHIQLLPNVALGTTAADVVVGSVTCGPNAVTGAGSLFAGPALPLSVAGAAAVGGVTVIRRRRRLAA